MTSVLFVSHDADLRAVGRRVLERAGCRVKTAAHAGHAFLACIENPTFDVLVIENELPEARGALVAERLRRNCPDMEIVRMCDSGSGTEGPGSAVVRPFLADDLIDAVQARRRATIR